MVVLGFPLRATSRPSLFDVHLARHAEASTQTTYTLKGRFAKGKHGSYTAVGTDSSPTCQRRR